jgi:hypothetical protein
MALECVVERIGPLPVVFRALEAAAYRVKDGWLEWVRVRAPPHGQHKRENVISVLWLITPTRATCP